MDSDEETIWINNQYCHPAPGQVITLEKPPASINIELTASDETTLELWKNFTLVQDQIVIPICEGFTNANKDTCTWWPLLLTIKSEIRIKIWSGSFICHDHS